MLPLLHIYVQPHNSIKCNSPAIHLLNIHHQHYRVALVLWLVLMLDLNDVVPSTVRYHCSKIKLKLVKLFAVKYKHREMENLLEPCMSLTIIEFVVPDVFPPVISNIAESESCQSSFNLSYKNFVLNNWMLNLCQVWKITIPNSGPSEVERVS